MESSVQSRPPEISSGTKDKPAKPAKRPSKSATQVLGLEDPRQALLIAPAGYLDCREACTDAGQATFGEKCLFMLRFTGNARGLSPSRRVIWDMPGRYQSLAQVSWPDLRQTRRTELEFVDDHGTTILVNVFGGVMQWKSLAAGQRLLLLGRLQVYANRHYLEFEMQMPDSALGRVCPRYPGIPGRLAAERTALAVDEALADPSSRRIAAAAIMGEVGLAEDQILSALAHAGSPSYPSLQGLLEALHTPASPQMGYAAVESAKRLSAMALRAAALRHHSRQPHPRAPIALDMDDLARIEAGLDVPLTHGQRTSAMAVATRLCEPKPLSGLLSGDVGTGKTLTFLLPAVMAHRAGAQVAIIAPRTLLAQQIADQIRARFGAFVRDVELVEAGSRIQNPDAILVGTPGFATVAAKCAYIPRFLICDEQHKLGTVVRESAIGAFTHLLEVSATPVPRSLQASLYEGMELLTLSECPVEKALVSEIHDAKNGGRAKAFQSIRQALDAGERAALIYPRVSSAEEGQESVESAFATFNALPEFAGKVAKLHGQMDEADIATNVAALKDGSKPFVIASTILEIGIDIPSIRALVVRDADCFGISQLHQLRGRLARNGGRGAFGMMVEDWSSLDPETQERLQCVSQTTDGHCLAELDMEQRGFGELEGSAQNGGSRTLFPLVRLRPEHFQRG